jgi:hypothetical protein
MRQRFVKAAVVLVVMLAAVVALAAARIGARPEPSPTPLQSHRAERAGAAIALPIVLARSCGDCHSNEPMPLSRSRIAPVSWIAARTESEGRRVVNFSEWGSYSPEQRQALLALSCRAASAGTMPGLWTLVRPETRLSPRDVATICAAASR